MVENGLGAAYRLHVCCIGYDGSAHYSVKVSKKSSVLAEVCTVRYRRIKVVTRSNALVLEESLRMGVFYCTDF